MSTRRSFFSTVFMGLFAAFCSKFKWLTSLFKKREDGYVKVFVNGKECQVGDGVQARNAYNDLLNIEHKVGFFDPVTGKVVSAAKLSPEAYKHYGFTTYPGGFPYLNEPLAVNEIAENDRFSFHFTKNVA